MVDRDVPCAAGLPGRRRGGGVPGGGRGLRRAGRPGEGRPRNGPGLPFDALRRCTLRRAPHTQDIAVLAVS
ncbi:hypothetical protein, partial [Streptomyces thermoalcalitolerans]|uniref:hypothetical protein n=1 Tax=Streptomyces thermoalcalitolerans TaxID=65605 RepID=UPI0031DED8BA